MMDQYQEIISRRNITRLCHFTKSSNLPYILGEGITEENGIISHQKVRQVNYLKVLDESRYDGYSDYVCCSVQKINRKLLVYRKNHDELTYFPDWVVIYVDPGIISDTSLFCPVNAATGKGRYVSRGSEAFENLFADELKIKDRVIYRKKGLADNIPTDIQAEVLIKDRIPKESIQAISFPTRSLANERQRLSYWYEGSIPIVQWEE